MAPGGPSATPARPQILPGHSCMWILCTQGGPGERGPRGTPGVRGPRGDPVSLTQCRSGVGITGHALLPHGTWAPAACTSTVPTQQRPSPSSWPILPGTGAMGAKPAIGWPQLPCLPGPRVRPLLACWLVLVNTLPWAPLQPHGTRAPRPDLLASPAALRPPFQPLCSGRLLPFQSLDDLSQTPMGLTRTWGRLLRDPRGRDLQHLGGGLFTSLSSLALRGCLVFCSLIQQ